MEDNILLFAAEGDLECTSPEVELEASPSLQVPLEVLAVALQWEQVAPVVVP